MRITYIGGTPGVDANTYTVVDTTQMGGSSVLSICGVRRIRVSVKNSETGTLKEYRSADKGGAWSQISETAVSAASATGVNIYEYSVSCFTDWKLEWVNGGSAQTTWAVDIAALLSIKKGNPTPNDIKVAGNRLVRGWWEMPSASGTGAVTLSEASVGDFDVWTLTNFTRSAGGDDPTGGSTGYTLQESTDGAPVDHTLYVTPTNYALSGYYVFEFWAKQINRRYINGSLPQGGINVRFGVDLADGSHLEDAGITVTTTAANGGYTIQILAKVSGVAVGAVLTVRLASSLTVSYAPVQGTGADSIDVHGPVLIQPRAAVIADLSLMPTGSTLRAGDLSQGTPDQPLAYAPFAADALGQATLLQETGRGSYLVATHADIASLFSGTEPSYVVCGVGALDSNYMHSARGAGTGLDAPLQRSGANLYTYRRDDASNVSNVIFSGGSGTSFDSICAWCVISIGANRYLYINGSYIGTATISGTGTTTITSYWVHSASASPYMRSSGGALYAGGIAGTHADIHAALLPSHRAMAARFGVTIP